MTVTDEYILSKDTVTSKEAAAYLGVSWWVLTDRLQKGEAPYGEAHKGRNGGQWVYTIYAERLYKFKHGEPLSDFDELREMLKEAVRMMTEVCRKVSELEEKRELRELRERRA